MQQEVVFSKNPNTKAAIEELYQKLSNKRNPLFVLFLASSHYDFQLITQELHARFPNSEVVGATTSGEISPMGFTDNTIVLTTMTCSKTKVKGVLLKDVQKFPILEKNRILKAASQCGIQAGDPNLHKNSFAIAFTNGLINREESLPALIHAIIKNKHFQVAGSCAGDNLNFSETWISLNGESTSKGGLILFFQTACKFDIRKENLYKPMGKNLCITDIDLEQRIIRSIDRQNPLAAFSQKMNMTREQAVNNTLQHPLGRVIGDDVYMCSIKNFNRDGTVGVYLNILPNSKLEILESTDVIETVTNTCQSITQKIGHPKFIFMVNCVIRTLDLKNRNLCSPVIQIYREYFPTFCGYSCYGEQLNRLALNQTLVTVTIGE